MAAGNTTSSAAAALLGVSMQYHDKQQDTDSLSSLPLSVPEETGYVRGWGIYRDHMHTHLVITASFIVCSVVIYSTKIEHDQWAYKAACSHNVAPSSVLTKLPVCHHLPYSPVHAGIAQLSAAAQQEASSVFSALRDTIYSEVATLIANNEARPHFLVRPQVTCTVNEVSYCMYFTTPPKEYMFHQSSNLQIVLCIITIWKLRANLLHSQS